MPELKEKELLKNAVEELEYFTHNMYLNLLVVLMYYLRQQCPTVKTPIFVLTKWHGRKHPKQIISRGVTDYYITGLAPIAADVSWLSPTSGKYYG